MYITSTFQYVKFLRRKRQIQHYNTFSVTKRKHYKAWTSHNGTSQKVNMTFRDVYVMWCYRFNILRQRKNFHIVLDNKKTLIDVLLTENNIECISSLTFIHLFFLCSDCVSLSIWKLEISGYPANEYILYFDSAVQKVSHKFTWNVENIVCVTLASCIFTCRLIFLLFFQLLLEEVRR